MLTERARTCISPNAPRCHHPDRPARTEDGAAPPCHGCPASSPPGKPRRGRRRLAAPINDSARPTVPTTSVRRTPAAPGRGHLRARRSGRAMTSSVRLRGGKPKHRMTHRDETPVQPPARADPDGVARCRTPEAPAFLSPPASFRDGSPLPATPCQWICKDNVRRRSKST